jgi:hypothetical protein
LKFCKDIGHRHRASGIGNRAIGQTGNLNLNLNRYILLVDY